MYHIFQVFKYELRTNLRRRGWQFTTFGLPLLAFVAFFGFQIITDLRARSGAPDPIEELAQSEQFEGITHAGYVDLSGLFPTPGQLSSILTRYPDETSAQAAMDAGEIDVYYTIAADYMETGDVTLHMPRFTLAQTDDNLIRSLIVQHLAQGIDQKLYLRLLNPASFREINLQRQAQPADTEQTTNEVVSNFDQDFLIVYIFSVVLMLGVFMTSGYLMQTVIEEKETRLIEILIAGMRPTYLLAGKILALGVLGMLQIGVWLLAMTLLARLAAASAIEALSSVAGLSLTPDRLILMIVYFIFGYLFFAAAFGIISAISTSMQEGPQYAIIFTLPAAIPLWFIVLFTTQPDGGLPTALSIIPLTSPISMMMRVAITNVPAFQIIISLLLLIITDIFLIWLAGRVFRVNTLLAGQVPKLRDLPRLLRG